MRTVRDAKAMAKALRAEVLALTQTDLPHSQCLEIVARQFGVESWNVLSALMEKEDGVPAPWRTAFADTTTIPVLRIFSETSAVKFYVDFLGFRLDFGGPSSGGDSPYYGQVSRPGATLHLSGQPYEPGPGSTVDIWVTGLEGYREVLLKKDLGVFGTALGVPGIVHTHWGAMMLPIPDPFGNHLRISEPVDPGGHANLPDWGSRS
jgi:catechol 2,3-dioxygenase-like lactoylglutathione lyase family enzyme